MAINDPSWLKIKYLTAVPTLDRIMMLPDSGPYT